MEAISLLFHGFAVLMTWKIILLMLLGWVLGIFRGCFPGLGGPHGVAILLAAEFRWNPTSAIVMLSSIYWAHYSAAPSPRSCQHSGRSLVGGDTFGWLSDGSTG